MSDRLLNALSMRGETSWEEFNDIFGAIYLSQYKRPSPNLNEERNISVRMLDCLGHCEFDFSHRKVYACPPHLAALPTFGLPKAVLTGARSLKLIDSLKQTIKNKRESARLVHYQHRGYPLAPEALLVEASDLKTIRDIADTLGIDCSLDCIPAYEIMNFACGIDDLIKVSDFTERAEPNWKCRVFSVESLHFKRQMENQEETRLVEYTNPVNHQLEHWFWRGRLRVEVDRDYGRYMALAAKRVNILAYDKLRKWLCVPEWVPLPRLFARALALCSGILVRVRISKNSKLKLFTGLTEEIAPRVSIFSEASPEMVEILSRKLSQEPTDCKIAIDKNGEIL